MGKKRSYYEKALEHPLAGIWHRRIFRMVKDLMPTNYERMSHLDVGCGDGITIRMVKPEGEIIGVDIDAEMLKYAQEKRIATHVGNAEDLSMFDDEAFDLVTCLDTLEHLEHPTLALSEAYRVLRKRGFLVITTPNVTALFRLVWWAWTKFGMGKFWKSSPHLLTYNLWNPTETGMSLIERLRDVGFKPERTAKANWSMVAGVRAIKI